MWRANASRETNYTYLRDAHEENETAKRRFDRASPSQSSMPHEHIAR
jgi:hypothetical protein